MNSHATITSEERAQLQKAKNLPEVFDEDFPALDATMETAFVAARKKKPYDVKPLTLYVSCNN